MAVVPRKRSGGVVYGVLTSWAGGKHWELVGANKREAETLNRKRLREVEAGTFRPGELTDAASVRAFAERWLELRANRSAENDRALVRRHVLSVSWFADMRIADVRPRDVLRLIAELDKTALSRKSVSLVMGLVRVMFRDAVIGDVLTATPYVVPRGVLKRSGERRTPYEAAEVRALLTTAAGERERVWNAIAFYTGARCGEVCGLRWGDWAETPVPLGALSIARQYEGQVLKTERARVVPVHPELEAVLSGWRARWSFHFLRRPEPGDLIVPALGGQTALTKSSAYKAWLRSCKASGVSNRSVHSTRHTFITLAQRGGADRRVVELITHNPKGTIIDVYTTRDWAELCEAVLCLSFDAPVDVGSNGSGNSGSSAWTRTSAIGDKPSAASQNLETDGSVEGRFFGSELDLDAPVDARRTVALALAARAALHGGRVPVGEPVPVTTARRRPARKGKASA
jgi:integrase